MENNNKKQNKYYPHIKLIEISILEIIIKNKKGKDNKRKTKL